MKMRTVQEALTDIVAYRDFVSRPDFVHRLAIKPTVAQPGVAEKSQSIVTLYSTYRFTIDRLPNHDILANLATQSAASFTPNAGEQGGKP